MSTRQRSIVWSFFKKAVDSNTVAKCVFCESRVAYTNTSNLLKHLRNKHRRETSNLWTDEIYPEANYRAMTSQLSDEEEAESNSATVTQVGEFSSEKDELYFITAESDNKNTIFKTKSTGKCETSFTRKSRSVVWKCFKKLGINSGSALCTLCGSDIRQPCGSTSNLLKHILNKHPVEYELLMTKQDPAIECKSPALEASRTARWKCFGPKRRNRSIVWRYFAKNAADARQVLCSFCGRMLKQPIGSTSNLVKHLYAKHHKEYRKMFPEDSAEIFDTSFIKDEKTEIEDMDDSEAQTQFIESDNIESDSIHCEVDQDGEQADSSVSEMCEKVRDVWLKHCNEREKQFAELMKAKQKEMIDIHVSMQKLQKQFSLLSGEIKQHKSRREAELRRQELMDLQFFSEEEASSHKQHQRKLFLQTCSLVKDILSNKISTPNLTAEVSNSLADTSNSGWVSCLDSKDNADGSKSTGKKRFSLGVFSKAESDEQTEEDVLVILPLSKVEKNGWSLDSIANTSKIQQHDSENEEIWSEVCRK